MIRFIDFLVVTKSMAPGRGWISVLHDSLLVTMNDCNIAAGAGEG
jgi:hypothetical protein